MTDKQGTKEAPRDRNRDIKRWRHRRYLRREVVRALVEKEETETDDN